MKAWLQITCLTLALAGAGCGSNQPFLEKVDTLDKERWKSMMVDEPSAQSTNWSLWVTMQGGG